MPQERTRICRKWQWTSKPISLRSMCMKERTVAEIHELALLAARIGGTFEVRRLYRRIEVGEITLRDGVRKLSAKFEETASVRVRE